MNTFKAIEDLKRMTEPPAMALDAWAARWATFDTDNARVEDPAAELRADRSGFDWSSDERRVFMEQFLAHPKVVELVCRVVWVLFCALLLLFVGRLVFC